MLTQLIYNPSGAMKAVSQYNPEALNQMFNPVRKPLLFMQCIRCGVEITLAFLQSHNSVSPVPYDDQAYVSFN